MFKDISLHRIGVIFKREYQNYFNTPIGYIFGIIYLFFTGFLFFYWPKRFWDTGIVDMTEYFVVAVIMFCMFVPAISMRLWAEENRTGTIETLLTLPVTDTEIILGKFFGAVAYLGTVLALSFTMPITLTFLGSPDYSLIIAGYVVTFIMGAAFISLGMLVSSFVKDQINAFVVALFSCFIFTFAGWEEVTRSLGDFLGTVAAYLSLFGHFDNMRSGILDFRDIIYFLSFIGILLYLNKWVLARRRAGQVAHDRENKYATVLTISAVLLFNVFLDSFPIRYDLTGKYNFTEATEKLVEKLPEPVTIEAFISTDVPADQIRKFSDARNYVRELAALDSKIKVRFHDMDDKEAKKQAEGFGVRSRNLGLQLGASGGKVDSGFDSLVVRYAGKHEVIPNVAASLDATDLEEDFYKIVNKYLNPDGVGVGYMVSNGAFSTEDSAGQRGPGPGVKEAASLFFEAMQTEFIKIRRVNLEEGPVDAAVKTLLVVGPTEISKKEVYYLDQFLMRGGNIIYFARNMDFAMSGQRALVGNPVQGINPLTNFFAHFGATVQNDYVHDYGRGHLHDSGLAIFNPGTRQVLPYPYLNLASSKTDSLAEFGPIADLENSFFLWPSSININKNKPNVDIKVLAHSSPRAEQKKGTGFGVILHPRQLGQMPPGGMPGARGKKGKFNFAVLVEPKAGSKLESSFTPNNLPEGISADGFLKQAQEAGQGRMLVISTPFFVGDILNYVDKTRKDSIDFQTGQRIIGYGAFVSHNFTFIKNFIDYMQGAKDFMSVREKRIGRGVQQINKRDKEDNTFYSILNLALMPLFLGGLGVYHFWRRRKREEEYLAGLKQGKE